MKSLKCDLCDHQITGDTFENWFSNARKHWEQMHQDVMKKMQETGTKEEGQKWMAEAKRKFEAA